MASDRAAPTAGRLALAALTRAWRERALLTQEQLAERTGLGVRTIRRLDILTDLDHPDADGVCTKLHALEQTMPGSGRKDRRA